MSEAIPVYGFGEQGLWRHSLSSATVAEKLNSFLHNPVPKLSFTAALIHDIGKLLLGRHITVESSRKIHKIMCEDNISYITAERQILGTDHAEVGGSIARYWNFPEQLIDAIELHHDPDKKPNGLVDVVNLSNMLAKHVDPLIESPYTDIEVSNNVTKRLGVSSADVEAIILKVSAELVLNGDYKSF